MMDVRSLAELSSEPLEDLAAGPLAISGEVTLESQTSATGDSGDIPRSSSLVIGETSKSSCFNFTDNQKSVLRTYYYDHGVVSVGKKNALIISRMAGELDCSQQQVKVG